MHLVNPNSTPNSGMRIFEPRILGPNSGVEFFGPMFSNKKSPLKNSPPRNSPPKIHIKKFTPEFGLKTQETADFRRKPQETADFRRNPFVPFSLSLLVPHIALLQGHFADKLKKILGTPDECPGHTRRDTLKTVTSLNYNYKESRLLLSVFPKRY